MLNESIKDISYFGLRAIYCYCLGPVIEKGKRDKCKSNRNEFFVEKSSQEQASNKHNSRAMLAQIDKFIIITASKLLSFVNAIKQDMTPIQFQTFHPTFLLSL